MSRREAPSAHKGRLSLRTGRTATRRSNQPSPRGTPLALPHVLRKPTAWSILHLPIELHSSCGRFQARESLHKWRIRHFPPWTRSAAQTGQGTVSQHVYDRWRYDIESSTCTLGVAKVLERVATRAAWFTLSNAL
jgi:hypothetical protein